jgi:anti-sigma regulatory factor (Ser/Thr protein kinase)
MPGEPLFSQRFEICGRDFTNAGKASSTIKSILKEIGLPPPVVRRVAIASYEAEMNVVLYARKGTMELRVTPRDVRITVADEGQGIADIPLAMQEGYSTASEEIREMGFGAGMGLPNINRNADEFTLRSVVGQGTTLEIGIRLDHG